MHVKLDTHTGTRVDLRTQYDDDDGVSVAIKTFLLFGENKIMRNLIGETLSSLSDAYTSHNIGTRICEIYVMQSVGLPIIIIVVVISNDGIHKQEILRRPWSHGV